MLKKGEIVVGAFVWWQRVSDRFAEWDCPCVVTYVKGNEFRVKSLDDLKETKNDLSMHDELLREMRTCSLREVKNYLRKEEHNLEGAVIKKKESLEEAEEKLAAYKQQATELLAEQEK